MSIVTLFPAGFSISMESSAGAVIDALLFVTDGNQRKHLLSRADGGVPIDIYSITCLFLYIDIPIE